VQKGPGAVRVAPKTVLRSKDKREPSSARDLAQHGAHDERQPEGDEGDRDRRGFSAETFRAGGMTERVESEKFGKLSVDRAIEISGSVGAAVLARQWRRRTNSSSAP
jgi:hypothetical protein